MQRKYFLASTILATSALAMSMPANAQEVLTGDTKLACEALLCLGSGTRPNECAPSLARYFGISYRKFSDTIKGRANFLNLCPASNQTPQMQSFASAIANGAGRCDPASLNVNMLRWWGNNGNVYISNQLPDYCAAYISNQYSNLGGLTPKYVGVPERDGYWVVGSEYDTALANYNARIAAEDAAKNQGWLGIRAQ
ncbi:MAG: conjugal transfer protein TrbM [Phyllobacteriaceae bacterium]|nr:conjugal transfer protein TrbM [Phyllobacteriaceae bacterium]